MFESSKGAPQGPGLGPENAMPVQGEYLLSHGVTWFQQVFSHHDYWGQMKLGPQLASPSWAKLCVPGWTNSAQNGTKVSTSGRAIQQLCVPGRTSSAKVVPKRVPTAELSKYNVIWGGRAQTKYAKSELSIISHIIRVNHRACQRTGLPHRADPWALAWLEPSNVRGTLPRAP